MVLPHHVTQKCSPYFEHVSDKKYFKGKNIIKWYIT